MKKIDQNKIQEIHCETFQDFVTEFKSIFQLKGSEIILAPVRSGKTFQSENFIFETVSKEKKKIVIFLTEKNLLVESSFSNVSFLFKKEQINYRHKLFMFEKNTSKDNMKNIKSFFKSNSEESLGIIATFCYFSGQRKSELFKSIIRAKLENDYEVIFIIDESESFFNSFYNSIVIDRPQDKLFKTPCRGNLLTAIDSSKSKLSLNSNLDCFNEYEPIKGALSATPGDPKIFEYYHLDSFVINKNQLNLNIETEKPLFSDFIVFSNITKISISHKIFITEQNIEGKKEILSLESDNTLNFNESLFETLEMLEKKAFRLLSCYSLFNR